MRFIIINHDVISTIEIFSYSPRTNDALPLNSLFWSPPTAVNRFDASDMTAPISLYISWNSLGLVRNVDKILNLGFEGLAGARQEQHTGVVTTPGPSN